MKKSLYIILVFISNIVLSQTITIPYNNTLKEFAVIIKHKGNSNIYDEIAYYKSDTSKIAWIKHINNDKTVGIYREFFTNLRTYKKQIYNQLGQKNGIYQEWDYNGKLVVSGQYKKDKKNGTWLYIKEKRNEVYRNGIKHGRWRIYEGKVPWSLYVYRKDTLKRTKK